MICCLNPHCPQENPSYSEEMKYCASCGEPLVLLLDRYVPIGRTTADESTVAYFARDREGLNDCIIRQLSIQNPQVGELAELEVKRLQELSRENSQICEILNYHMDSEYLYVIQSFVEGQNLEKYLERHGVFSEQEVIDCLKLVLPILQSIHNNNIIHRDLRLDNIVRRSNGELILNNFAVNRQSTGNIFEFDRGTPGYTAFELKEQSISNPASDLYSLGAACFHLLTGKHPQIAFEDLGYDWTSKWQEYLDRSSTGEDPPISDRLCKVIDKLLQKDCRDRYQSARDVSKAISSVDREMKKQDSIRANIAGDLTSQTQSKVTINSLMDANNSPVNLNQPPVNLNQPPVNLNQPPVDLNQPPVNLNQPPVDLNQPPRKVVQKSLVELPQKRIVAVASALLFGSLAAAVILFPTFQRQYKSADRFSRGEATSTRESENSSVDPNNNSADINTSSGQVNNNRETIAGLTEAVKRNPRDANSYFQRGNIRSNAKDKKGAIADYTQSIAIDPKESEVYSQRGNAHSAIGNKKAAIKDYTQVIKLEPDRVDAYFHRALDRANIGDRKGAIEDYTQVIRLEPNRADAYFDRGNVRAASGDKKGAIEDLTKSIQYKPSRAAAYKNRGNALAAIGDKQGAAKDYLQASKLAQQ
jgi:serine/threonine protein kinase